MCEQHGRERPLAKEPLVVNTVGWGESKREFSTAPGLGGWAPSAVTVRNSKRLQRTRVSSIQRPDHSGA